MESERLAGSRYVDDVAEGQENPDWWSEFALWFYMEFVTGIRTPRPSVLIPVPSSGPNHALGFARAFQQILGWELDDVLATSHTQKLKTLNRSDRQKAHFERRDPPDLCRVYNSVVLIDDIVTTGATAHAAYLALNRPKHFQLWCLSDRRPCGQGRRLL